MTSNSENWVTLFEMINASKNHIIWISSENCFNDTKIDFCVDIIWRTSAERHGYLIPYIFRLNNSLVPTNLKEYEIYELSSDFPRKMPEIFEYLKRGPAKGIHFYYVSLHLFRQMYIFYTSCVYILIAETVR